MGGHTHLVHALHGIVVQQCLLGRSREAAGHARWCPRRAPAEMARARSGRSRAGRSLETAAGGISAQDVLLLLEPLGASVTPGTSGR